MCNHSQDISVKLWSLHSQSMWITSVKNIQGLVYAHTHALKVAVKLPVKSVTQKCNPSIPLLSAVMRDCRKIAWLSWLLPVYQHITATLGRRQSAWMQTEDTWKQDRDSYWQVFRYHLQCTRIPRFFCANSGYKADFCPPMWHENERGYIAQHKTGLAVTKLVSTKQPLKSRVTYK